jgi:hypothetical protein
MTFRGFDHKTVVCSVLFDTFLVTAVLLLTHNLYSSNIKDNLTRVMTRIERETELSVIICNFVQIRPL